MYGTTAVQVRPQRERERERRSRGDPEERERRSKAKKEQHLTAPSLPHPLAPPLLGISPFPSTGKISENRTSRLETRSGACSTDPPIRLGSTLPSTKRRQRESLALATSSGRWRIVLLRTNRRRA